MTLDQTAASADGCSSTPASASFTDPSGDTTGADILSVDAILDDACLLIINPVLDSSRSAGLTIDDAVFTYLDTDGDTTTGDSNRGGADVGVVARAGTGPILFKCATTPCDFETLGPLSPVGVAGFETNVSAIAPTANTLGISVEAEYLPPAPALPNTDFAPDSSPAFSFPAGFVVVGSPQTAPAPLTGPPLGRAGPKRCHDRGCYTDECTVPPVKGRTVSAAKRLLRKAHCQYTIKGRGRVVSTKPRAGARTRGIVRVKAKSKRGKAKKRDTSNGPRCESGSRRCPKRKHYCQQRKCYTCKNKPGKCPKKPRLDVKSASRETAQSAASDTRGERRDSNPRPPGPQPGALPTELRPPRSAAVRGARPI